MPRWLRSVVNVRIDSLDAKITNLGAQLEALSATVQHALALADQAASQSQAQSLTLVSHSQSLDALADSLRRLNKGIGDVARRTFPTTGILLVATSGFKYIVRNRQRSQVASGSTIGIHVLPNGQYSVEDANGTLLSLAQVLVGGAEAVVIDTVK